MSEQGQRGERGEKGDRGPAVNDWKTWALAILFTIVTATSGITYNNAINRITSLEETQHDSVQVTTDTAIQIAKLQSSLDELKTSLGSLDMSQASLLVKMDALVTNMLRDSRRWNEEMDRIQAENRDRR